LLSSFTRFSGRPHYPSKIEKTLQILILKCDSTSRGLDNQMQRLGQAAREMPHATDKCQFNNLAPREIFLHFLERRFVLFRCHDGDFIRPADSSFFLIAE